ncbi:ubiquitin receptor RAD23d-like [Hibiscus syriacus]|uniref:ubiquitin receptor RAD23d-like n=1 Tax=Hibiscus syriacus TaxID=106335 RepID=UPI001923A39E|nr:ubiquitin receptor RAD23d-like [Hibiscus syriacus]
MRLLHTDHSRSGFVFSRHISGDFNLDLRGIEGVRTMRVGDVKNKIETVQGAEIYFAAQEMLIHKDKVLKDETTLSENSVAENRFIVIMLAKVFVSSYLMLPNLAGQLCLLLHAPKCQFAAKQETILLDSHTIVPPVAPTPASTAPAATPAMATTAPVAESSPVTSTTITRTTQQAKTEENSCWLQ